MTPQDFTYWLQGFVELTEGQVRPTERQWTAIQQHLDLVFNKVTPPMNENNNDRRTIDTRSDKIC